MHESSKSEIAKTYHVLHQGRAEYTLIYPGENGNPPRVEKHVMGTNAAAGEVRQLLVGTSVWKVSRLLPQDVEICRSTEGGVENWGCLITEVVVPGFAWEDHTFLTLEELKEIFAGVEGGEKYVNEYSKFLRKSK